MRGAAVSSQGRFWQRQAAHPHDGNTDVVAAVGTAVALLAALGAVTVFSASAPLALETAVPPHFLRHVGALGIGACLAWLASRVPLKFWYRTAPLFWGLSILLLVLTALFGHSVNGARRWLVVPGLDIAFQPAEIAKLATLVAAAAWLSGQEGKAALTRHGVLGALALAAIPALLCITQPDLGNAVLLVALTGILLFVGGAPLRILLGPALAGIAGIAIYSFLQPHAMRRWIGFLDPWGRANAEGFQLVQSFVAFGRGGWFGVGLGDGRQKLFYLPEAHTDFVLSVVAEELGLIGVLFALGGFAALWVAGLRITLRARRRFPMLLAFGMTSLIALPAAMNAAVVMGLLPTKGLTLPFISYGRTSLLVSCIAVGILIAVAREPARSTPARRSRR
ncbi:MAG: cell division protein FtsW [bacterium]|nr:cell division protein FtsW [bacterium]